MSLLPCVTFANPNVELYSTGGGGGGGGSNLTPSSITMSGPISMNNNQIYLSQNFTDSQVYFDANNSTTYIRGLSTFGVNVGTAQTPDMIKVRDTFVTINGDANVVGTMNVSSITGVSTINGTAYPPTADYYADIIPQSAAFNLGPVSVPAAGQQALSSTFSVVSGHSYRFTTSKVQLSNTDTATNQQIAVGGTGQSPIPVCQTVSGLLTNSGNNFAATQYVCTWRQQGSGPCEVVVYNNSTTQPTLVTMDSIIGMPHIVEDLGALI